MSAPDTNIEKQEKRHKPALLGIKGAMIFGVLMILILAVFVIGGADEPTADAVTNTDQATQGGAEPVAVDEVAPGTNSSN